MLILQHPKGEPAMVAWDMECMPKLNHNETRVSHTVNTDYGSSGAPIFDRSWNLVAIHNAGDPGNLALNQGIPIDAIAEKIKAFLPG